MNEDQKDQTEQKKSAFVALVGRPSVGKSTLVNFLCGAKVAIVSAVPQTTRNAIRGIVNREQGQLVLVDTPGRHDSEKKLNKKLRELSDRALDEADIVLYLLDATRAPGHEEEAIAARLAPLQNRLAAAVNKMDEKSAGYDGVREILKRQLPDLNDERCFKISALNGEGTGPLLDGLYKMAPEGPALYGEDYYTDQDVPFRIAEIIREKAINRLRQELPHSLYVDVADTEFRDEGKKLWVRAFIVTERESQKGMVVGKDGAMIKAIRQAAQKDMKKIFDWKIELDLRVKSSGDWRHNDALLKRLTGR
jgi:GTP-binding protein Era